MSLTEKFSTSGSLFDNSGTVVGKTRRIRGANHNTPVAFALRIDIPRFVDHSKGAYTLGTSGTVKITTSVQSPTGPPTDS
jgi:hypothetical protein